MCAKATVGGSGGILPQENFGNLQGKWWPEVHFISDLVPLDSIIADTVNTGSITLNIITCLAGLPLCIYTLVLRGRTLSACPAAGHM